MEIKKLKKREVAVSSTAASHCDCASFAVTALLYNKNIKFLVDTGADVSILPREFKHKSLPFQIQLTAANGTNINSYGYLMTYVTFPELKRSFQAKFIVADVTTPILGADFFKEHNLLIDVGNQCFVDNETKFRVNLARHNLSIPKIHVISLANENLLNVLSQNSAVFDASIPHPQPTASFKIVTTGVPKPSRAYRLSPEKTKAAKEEIEKEIKLGRMKRSSSEYASPFFPVPKPDGSWRFVADYTRLNELTVKDNYIPPKIDDLLSRIPANCVFSKLDLEKAFFQIPIDPEDQPKTAVITPFGLYEYTVMSMGLKNASQTMQRYVDSVLCDFTNVIAYCDDILLFTQRDQHCDELDRLLQTIHKSGLIVNRKKSLFQIDEIKFLGHHLTQNGYLPSEEKVVGLKNFKPPTTPKQVRRFLGVINFYRKFIPHASELQKPLTALTHKGAAFVWTSQCQEAFDKLIDMAINAAQLIYPDSNDEYVLTTDASSIAAGAVLSSQNGPIGFFSQQFRNAELNYSVYDKELLAVYKAVKHFEWLLFGRKFILKVDHKPLLHIFGTPAKSERRRRQIEYLSTFDISIEYLPGKENVVADALSRDNCIDTIQLILIFRHFHQQKFANCKMKI